MVRDLHKIIDRYADGFFEYDTGKLCFSVPTIEADLPVGEMSSGTFRIYSTDGREFEASLFTTDMRVVCRNNEVQGSDVMIHYVFDPTGLESGAVVKGDIRVLSDCGEYFLPFTFTMVASQVRSSLGNIRNLFHFANQAQSNWEEAISLFYSPSFLRVFSGNDHIHLDKYRGLSRKRGDGQAVDDFLVAVNKKRPITYRVDHESYEYSDVSDELRCEIPLHKSTWGHVDIILSSSAPFLKLERSYLNYADFLGNTHKIVLYINSEKLHEGRNYGTVSIHSPYQEITVNITARRHAHADTHRFERRERKALMARLVRAYISFRMKKTAVNTWVRESMKIVERLNALDEKNPLSRLFQAQLLLVQQRDNEANWILEHIENQMNINSAADDVYAYYLYLKSLSLRSDEYTDEVAGKVRTFYENHPDSFEILWTLIYLDEEMSRNSPKKLEAIMKQCDAGSSSPILYIEAYNYYTANPDKLTKLGELELKVLLFAAKQGVMDAELKKQILYLSSRQRAYSTKLYKLLVAVYEIEPDDELVSVIATLLIKGGKCGPEYFRWFERSVELQLRITRLYEYFMYSLPDDYPGALPKAVLMYFNFRTDMDKQKIAYLYANLIEYKRDLIETYEAYRENIQIFAVEQIGRCAIDHNLAVIYNDVLFPEMIRPDMAGNLAKILFAHEVDARESKAARVILIQEQFEDEQVFNVSEEGYAYPIIYSSNYSLLYEDSRGRRSLVNESNVRKLINEAVFVPTIRGYVNDNVYFSMYLCEGKKHYITVDEDNNEYCRELVESDLVRESYKRDVRIALLHYYYDNDLISTLDEFLMGINYKLLSAKDRAEAIKFLVRRGMFEKAYELIGIYGAEEVSAKVCVRICNHMIEHKDRAVDTLLIKLCYRAFVNGKYDEVTLRYLVDNYEGMTKELRNIWKAAISFEVDCYRLMERIIEQMLYAHTTVGEKEEIFEQYLKCGANTRVELAYLSYAAYEYFVHERVTDERVFSHIVRNYRMGEKLNDACRLGILKYYAEEASYDDEETRAMINDFILDFLHRNMYFMFFTNFRDIVPELSDYVDKTVVEYRTNPGNRVLLHYIFETGSTNEQTYRTEEMRNIFGGVFSREFILFFGENLQYYITEEENGKEMLTYSDSISLNDTSDTHADSRYSLINDMVVSRTVQDELTLLKLMEEYVEADDFARRVFKIR